MHISFVEIRELTYVQLEFNLNLFLILVTNSYSTIP